jgi:ech hydrogenase subunit D
MGQQTIKQILSKELLSETLHLKNDGYRLVAISCTSLKSTEGGTSGEDAISTQGSASGEDIVSMELSYSFDKDYDLLTLRVITDTKEEISSISIIYPFAFLYENEIKELFGVKIKDITVDFNHSLYKIPVKTPFKKAGDK